MTDMEIAYMVAVLVLMSAEHFRNCVYYVEKVDMLPEEQQFMERVVSIARMKRKARAINEHGNR